MVKYSCCTLQFLIVFENMFSLKKYIPMIISPHPLNQLPSPPDPPRLDPFQNRAGLI